MRPEAHFLETTLLERIIDEAMDVLAKLGVEVQDESVRRLCLDNGASLDPASGRVLFPPPMVERSCRSAPSSFNLFDLYGQEAVRYEGKQIHFTPGSAAINILDYSTGAMRKPGTLDYIDYSKIVSACGNIAVNSTALIPADVHAMTADSYRLYLSLLFCSKPVVTGAFTAEGFAVMKELQTAVRGGEKELEHKPLAVFSCCPTSPLKWSDATSRNLVDCARSMVPVELIAMPLSGFMAPVTLVGTLVQHTAETLSGVAIHQSARPGAPLLYGGSPAIFDVRYETTPMGAMETMMIDCAFAEIGRSLGLPTQAYISFSDAKMLDAQAGLETGMGACMAALAGINSISGPGMLDFESCQSMEKLVVDNEICGMALRLARGIEPREDFPALDRFRELLSEKHLLIAEHTRRHLKNEFHLPGPVIDRAQRDRWIHEGSATLGERAHREADRLIKEYAPPTISTELRRECAGIMTSRAKQCGMDRLPDLPL